MAEQHEGPRAVPDTPGARTSGHRSTGRRPLRERHVDQTVEVAVPVRTAYNQWTQFKSFPRFSAVVRDVEQVRPTVTAWTLGYGPLRRRFAVEILEQDPDAYLAWRGLEQRPWHRGGRVQADGVRRHRDHRPGASGTAGSREDPHPFLAGGPADHPTGPRRADEVQTVHGGTGARGRRLARHHPQRPRATRSTGTAQEQGGPVARRLTRGPDTARERRTHAEAAR